MTKRTFHVFVPWIVNGGADYYLVDLLQRVHNHFIVRIYSQGQLDKSVLSGLEYTSCSIADQEAFVKMLDTIAKDQRNIILIHGSSLAYSNISLLKKVGSVIDVLHNDSHLGHITSSIAAQTYISHWIVANKIIKKSLMKHNISKDKITLMNYVPFIESARSSSNQDNHRINTAKKCTNLIFVGRISEEKCPLLTVNLIDQLYSILPNERFHMSIIGDGPLRYNLERRIAESQHTSCFTLHGFLARTLISSHLLNSHFLVNLSTCEGSPLTFAEALCLGLPIFTLAAGGNSPLIDENYNSYISDNIKMMAIQLTSCIPKYNVENYLNMAQNARNTYVRFSTLSKKAFDSALDIFSSL